jgi:uncharacterized membrane protein YhaH (DUF805 family)
MAYVEMLRARRVLVWFAGVLAVLVVLVVLSATQAHHRAMIDHTTILLSAILGGAAMGPLLVAGFLANGLNAEHATTAILWTRPLARPAIAWRYVAVDLAALVVAYVLTIVAALICMAAFGVLPWLQADAHSVVTVPLALACPAMLYGWIQLIAARLPGRAGAVAGGMWFAMLVLTPLLIAPFPPLLHDLVAGLDYLNPLIWLGNHGSSEDGPMLIPFSTGWRAVGAGLIALVALVASIQLWSTREA